MNIGGAGLLIPILIYAVAVAIGALVLYLVIRFAVRAGVEEALSRHELRQANWRDGKD